MNTLTPSPSLSFMRLLLSAMCRLTTLTTGFFLLASFAHGQEEATFEGLGVLPGDSYSVALGVSGDGSTVVGDSQGDGSEGTQAFRWTEQGGMEGLGDLEGGSNNSSAYDASADGSVIVGYATSEEGSEAFRWTEEGGMEGLGGSEARRVSADGSTVVGYIEKNGLEAFRWTEDGGLEGLGDLPGGESFSAATGISADGSVIVGVGTSEEGSEAFRWEAGTMVGLGDLSGGLFGSFAQSISANGSVIVGYGNSTDGQEAFRRVGNGDMEGLGDLPEGSFESWATDASSDGSVVVGYGYGPFPQLQDAFIWTEQEGMRSLKEMLEEDYGLDLSVWELPIAYAISDDGTVIVGNGLRLDGEGGGIAEAFRVTLPHEVADEVTPENLPGVLSTPHPNPARGSTSFALRTTEAQHVIVEVFNTTGRQVTTLYNGALVPGTSETFTLDATALPAGVYVIRASGEDFSETRRVTVLR